MPAQAVPRRLPLIALLLILLVGGGLRVAEAAAPGLAYESPDERSYGKLAKTLQREGRYGDGRGEPLHWPPGAPVLFAVGDAITPTPASADRSDIPAAYWLQALAATALLAAVYGIAALLAGPVAGLLAAGLIAVYPPLIYTTGELMSEPLGALLLALATLATLWGLRGGLRWPLPAAGALYGLTVLTRTDLLFMLPIAALFVALVGWRRGGLRAGLLGGVALAVAGGLTILPWTLYASSRANELVPVTTGGGSALFVGTYLPGGGTTVGLKYALADELRARYPLYRDRKVYKIPASLALDHIARRHPGMRREAALQREARINLVRYGLGQPVAFARMVLAKVRRLWLFYYRGGGRHYILGGLRAFHVGLVLLAGLGLLAGLVRRRDPGLLLLALTVLYGTLLHGIFVSQARYNLPLLPILVAGGAAGIVLALRSRPPAPAPVVSAGEPLPADRPLAGATPA